MQACILITGFGWRSSYDAAMSGGRIVILNWYFEMATALRSFHKSLNVRSGDLHKLCVVKVFLSLTPFSRQSLEGSGHWYHKSWRNSQIDYILLNKRCRNSVHNSEACSCFSSIDGYHRLVTENVVYGWVNLLPERYNTTGQHFLIIIFPTE